MAGASSRLWAAEAPHISHAPAPKPRAQAPARRRLVDHRTLRPTSPSASEGGDEGGVIPLMPDAAPPRPILAVDKLLLTLENVHQLVENGLNPA